MTALPLSVLDLCPIPAGHSAGEALANSLDLAPQVEAMGYERYWLAEHHNTPMLASAAPELMIARVGAVTKKMRVGAGGIMLPNHASLKVAETFRVLEAMAPGRIDLGLGRAPGTDPLTASLLRRSTVGHEEDFVRQLAQLLGYLSDQPPDIRVAAMPFGVGMPEIWILGSTLYGAHLAAVNGFHFAFAHHIQPEAAVQALQHYRREFEPSQFSPVPRAMIAIHAICAETDEAAERLASSADLALVNFLRGRPGPIPSVEQATAHVYTPEDEMIRRSTRARLLVGSPSKLRTEIEALVQATSVDEVMVHGIIHDHAARVQSYALLAQAFELTPR